MGVKFSQHAGNEADVFERLLSTNDGCFHRTIKVNWAAATRSKRSAQEDLSALLREWKEAKSQMEAAIKKVDIPEIISPDENYKNFEGLNSLYKEDIPIELWAAFLIASIFLVLLGLMCYKCRQNSRI